MGNLYESKCLHPSASSIYECFQRFLMGVNQLQQHSVAQQPALQCSSSGMRHQYSWSHPTRQHDPIQAPNASSMPLHHQPPSITPSLSSHIEATPITTTTMPSDSATAPPIRLSMLHSAQGRESTLRGSIKADCHLDTSQINSEKLNIR